jgi:gamma-glutamyltranspeptidase/glutathione hydrolase
MRFRAHHRIVSVSLTLSLLVCSAVSAASRQPIASSRGLVASTSPLASDVGAQILRDGGNAIDAAVAVGLALAVTWPAAGNLGGGGFALLRLADGSSHFVDYRETAPAAAQADFYLDKDGKLIPDVSSVGWRSVAVPGTPAGMELMHTRWGKLPWKKVVEPARRLAEKGYRLEEAHVRSLAQNEDLLSKFPESKAIFLPGGKLPKVGDLFVQKDLGKTLAALEKRGAKGFYEGPVAELLAKDILAQGGVITTRDLKDYKALVREPLKGRYKDFEVLTAPPPSSGGAVLLQILGQLEQDDLKALGFGSAGYLHLLAEAMKRAFADRAHWFGDPGFVSVPLQKLLDPLYLKARRQSIAVDKASPSETIKAGPLQDNESWETTHYTVVDKDGAIVSNTYTLNGSFGSGATAKGTGVLLNNEMDDFASKPGEANMYRLIQGERNRIAPGKRPLSSMTPTVFLKDGRAILALGSPGGPTIINTVLQVSLNVLVHGMNIQEAIDAPRIHHQWQPDRIFWEPWGINPDTRKILEQMGHKLAERQRQMGDTHAVYFDAEKKDWTGASDSRWGGAVRVP